MNKPTTVQELIETLCKFPGDTVLVNTDLEPTAVHLDMEPEGMVIEIE